MYSEAESFSLSWECAFYRGWCDFHFFISYLIWRLNRWIIASITTNYTTSDGSEVFLKNYAHPTLFHTKGKKAAITWIWYIFFFNSEDIAGMLWALWVIFLSYPLAFDDGEFRHANIQLTPLPNPSNKAVPQFIIIYTNQSNKVRYHFTWSGYDFIAIQAHWAKKRISIQAAGVNRGRCCNGVLKSMLVINVGFPILLFMRPTNNHHSTIWLMLVACPHQGQRASLEESSYFIILDTMTLVILKKMWNYYPAS